MRALVVGAVLTAFAAIAVAVFSPLTQGAKSEACGPHERWKVKTLTDTSTTPGAADVDFAHPKTKKVEWLEVEADSGKTAPFAAVEKAEASLAALPDVGAEKARKADERAEEKAREVGKLERET